MSGAYLEKEMSVLDCEPLKVIAEVVNLKEEDLVTREGGEGEKKIFGKLICPRGKLNPGPLHERQDCWLLLQDIGKQAWKLLAINWKNLILEIIFDS